ncbi:MAG: hypothetical protein QW041_03350 [Candidatus Pacearchaeota archaeon]
MNHHDNRNGNEIKFQKAKTCSENGANLARLTDEGYVCPIYGSCCIYRGQMTKKFTNYFYCDKKGTAFKYQQKYDNIRNQNRPDVSIE